MFFKNDNHPNAKKNADIACWATFIFWSVLLLLNSIYEFVFDKVLVSSSLTILLAGLVVFFSVDLLLRVLSVINEKSYDV